MSRKKSKNKVTNNKIEHSHFRREYFTTLILGIKLAKKERETIFRFTSKIQFEIEFFRTEFVKVF